MRRPSGYTDPIGHIPAAAAPTHADARGDMPNREGVITESAALDLSPMRSTGDDAESIQNARGGLTFGAEHIAQAPLAGAPMPQKPQVLAVDDEGHQLASMRRVLKRSGIEVICASSGPKALRMTVSQRPDLILVDVSMPGMSGQEFVRRYRRQERELYVRSERCVLPVPVIFVSGRSGLSHRLSGLDAGAIDYIVKPIIPEDLRARVRTHLRYARIQQERLESFDKTVAPAA